MIYGGYNSGTYFGDVIVFNTNTNQCQKVVSDGASKFWAYSNRCVQAANDKVVGLVSELFEKKATVFSWTKGASAITVIQQLN